MKFLILIFVLLAPISAHALLELEGENYRQAKIYSNEEAFRITTGTLLKQHEVGILVKSTETWAWKQVKSVGISENYIRFTSTVLAPIIYGKISTKGLHMHWEPYSGLTLRPDVEYLYRNGTFSSSFNLIWRF